MGNPDLEPVTITATELAFNYQPTPYLSLDLSLFYHEIEDVIASEPATPLRTRFENSTDQHGHGGEISARWRITPALTLSGYYAYQRNQRDETDDDIGLAPRNKIKLRADWQPWTRWRLNTIATYVGDRRRPRDDPRDAPDDYLLVDLNAAYRLAPAANIALTVTNLFDEDAVAPDEPGDEDIPLAERGIFLNLRYAY